MSDIHKPSGEQSIIAVFHHKPEYKYRITVKYDNFPQSIIYRSTRSAQELMQWFLSDIRHGNPCLVQDISNKYPVVLNLGKANVIEITQLEE